MDASVTAAAMPTTGFDLGETQDGLASIAYSHYRQSPASFTTSIDVLEISKNSDPHYQWHQGLNHDALLRRFEVRLRHHSMPMAHMNTYDF